MKITQKKGAELFHPQFLVLRLQTKFHALRKKRPQSVKLRTLPQLDLLYDDCTRNHTIKKYMSYGVNF